MPSREASQRLKASLTSRSASEITSLISHGKNVKQYGSDDPSARCCMKAKEPFLSSKAARSAPSLGSLPTQGTLAWQCLAGGWSDHVSLRLQNSGSVARDHLALERTFLAYMRTSLAIASAGVALVQLFNTSSQVDAEKAQGVYRPLGASMIVVGLLVLAMGLVRYFMVEAALVKGVFPVARSGVVFIAIILMLLVTVVFTILSTGEFGGL